MDKSESVSTATTWYFENTQLSEPTNKLKQTSPTQSALMWGNLKYLECLKVNLHLSLLGARKSHSRKPTPGTNWPQFAHHNLQLKELNSSLLHLRFGRGGADKQNWIGPELTEKQIVRLAKP